MNNITSTSLTNWSQSVISPPLNLNKEESKIWDLLNQKFAPLVIGDKIGDMEGINFPSLLGVEWCSLYPLSIYFMQSLSVSPNSLLVDISPPNSSEKMWSGCGYLIDEFWCRRNYQLKNFQEFLLDWDLSETLGISGWCQTPNFGREIFPEISSYEEDRKLLGLHQFYTWEEVNDYATRWIKNPLIQDTPLSQHRMIISRGIDLICSELLANGFEHSGKSKKAKVFIMAKLCSRQSAWRALEENTHNPYLTPTEISFFTHATKHKYPILQICIGDTGTGFLGNKDLCEHFREEKGIPLKEGEKEADLVKFALSGKVSTKTRKEHRSFWKEALNATENVVPRTHGLAEVNRFIRKMHGYWRIHTNSTVVDYNFFDHPLSNSFPAQSLSGCLHYIMLPLFPNGNFPVSQSIHNSDWQGLYLIDAADDALAGDPENWIGNFCDRIVKVRDDQIGQVLVHLDAFEHLDENSLEDACIDLVHCFHHVRDDLAIIISGATEQIRYHLSQYSTSKVFDLSYRLILYLILDHSSNGQIFLEIDCSKEIELIKGDLFRILSGDESEEIHKSDDPEKWDLAMRVYEENRALFFIEKLGNEGDEALKTRINFEERGSDDSRVLFGGFSFSELTLYLLKHRAIARYSEEGYFRRGEMLSTYVHIGHLWADYEFQSKALNWLRIAYHRAQPKQAGILGDGRNLVLVAYLHPAIEMAHDLIRQKPFAKAEVIEIRRVSDLRWDFEPLLKVSGRKVAFLIDMFLTGNTIRSAVDVVRYLGLEPWACFSLLSNESSESDIIHHSFCQCTLDQLNNLGKEVKGKHTNDYN